MVLPAAPAAKLLSHKGDRDVDCVGEDTENDSRDLEQLNEMIARGARHRRRSETNTAATG